MKKTNNLNEEREMLKVRKEKNRNGVEFNTIDIGNLIRVSTQMFDLNDNHYNQGSFYGQCSLCAKAIKNAHTSFSIICVGNTTTAVQLNQDDIARDSGGYMESFELGSECGKRIKREFKNSGLNWKDYLITHTERRA